MIHHTGRLVPTPPSARRVTFATHGTCTPRLIVLHDTEGGTPPTVVNTLLGRAYGVHWITGQRGGIIRGNPANAELWHVAYYNPEALGIEQCGWASLTPEEWLARSSQLLAAAWIVAYEAQRHGIPLVYVSAHDVSWRSGVTSHAALGVAGGGHRDPGAAYPFPHVLGMARSIQTRGLGRFEELAARRRARNMG